MYVANIAMVLAVALIMISDYACLATGRLIGGIAFGYYSFLVPLSRIPAIINMPA